MCLLFLALDRSVESNTSGTLIANINNDMIDRRKSMALIVVAIFYITFGTVIFGLVVAQSFQNDILN